MSFTAKFFPHKTANRQRLININYERDKNVNNKPSTIRNEEALIAEEGINNSLKTSTLRSTWRYGKYKSRF